jgi:hypothetical protein
MGSTHSYPSMRRLAQLQRLAGVWFHNRPFHSLVIPQVMKRIPVADKSVRSATPGAILNGDRPWYGIPGLLPAPVRCKTIDCGEPHDNRRYVTGASILFAPPIAGGFSSGRKHGASPTCRKACAIWPGISASIRPSERGRRKGCSAGREGNRQTAASSTRPLLRLIANFCRGTCHCYRYGVRPHFSTILSGDVRWRS